MTAFKQPLHTAGGEIQSSETPEVYRDVARVALNAIPRSAGILNIDGVLIDCNRAAVEAGHVAGSIPFRVFFPAGARPVREAPAAAETALGEGTILVVDDEEIIRRVAAAALLRHGYKVLAATNGLEALEIYAKSPDSVDLILLDMTMPVMGGRRPSAGLPRSSRLSWSWR